MNISALFEMAVLLVPVIGIIITIILVVIAARLKAIHQTLVETQDIFDKKQ